MNAGELYVTMGLDMTGYMGALNTAQKAASTVGNIIKNALSFTIGMGAFEAIKAGFEGTIKTAIDFNSMIENATIGFTTMLGSAEKAQAFLNQMGDFAAKTPFEYPDLLQASQRMMALGFAADEVLPTLQAIGDATAAMGKGSETIDAITYALGQMRMAGRVNAQDMMQLTNAGINAWGILANAIGKSIPEVRKLAEEGRISGQWAATAIVQGIEKQFPNMMNKMQNTWQGVTSTIKDVWRMTIGAMTSNLFKGVTQWLGGVRDWANDFYNTFKQFGLQAALVKSFGAEVASVFITIGNVIKWVWNIGVSAAKWIAANWAYIKPIVLGAVTAFLLFNIANKILAATQSFSKGVALAMQVLQGQATATAGSYSFLQLWVAAYKTQLNAATAAGIVHISILQKIRYAVYGLYTALGALGIALLAVSAALTGIMMLWGKYSASVQQSNLNKMMAQINDQTKNMAGITTPAVKSVGNLASGLGKTSDAAKKASKAMSDNIQSFDEVHQIATEAASGLDDMSAGLGDIGNLGDIGTGELTMPDMTVPDLSTQFEEQKPTIKGFLDWCWSGIQDLWNKVASWPIWDTIAQSWDMLWQHAKDTWQATSGVVMTIWSNFSDFMNRTSLNLVNTMFTNFGLIADFWGRTWANLQTTGNNIWGNISKFFGDTWSNLKQTGNNIWSDLSGLWSTTWTNAQTTGHNIWSDISNFFGTTWGNLKQTGNNIWGSISSYLGTTWNDTKTTGRSIWDELSSYFSTTWNNTQTTASNIWGTTKDIITGKVDLRTGVRTIWDDISTYFGTTWGNTQLTASNIWGQISTFFGTTWGNTKLTASNIWGSITNFLGTTWTNAQTTGHNIWTEIGSFFSTTWSNTQTTASDIWGNITNFLGTTWSDAQTTGHNIWGEVQKFFGTTWNDINTTTSNIWGNTKGFLNTTWSDLQTTAGTTWESVRKTVYDKMNWLIGPLSSVWNSISSTASSTWKGIANAVIRFVNGIIGAINGMIRGLNALHFSVPDWVPVLGGKSFGFNLSTISTIPYLAQGGIVTKPTLAMIGEAGPEAVVPLSRAQSSDDIAQAVYQAIMDAFRITSATQSASSDREIVLKIDNTTLARLQLPAIIKEGQRQGLNLVVQPQGV